MPPADPGSIETRWQPCASGGVAGLTACPFSANPSTREWTRFEIREQPAPNPNT